MKRIKQYLALGLVVFITSTEVFATQATPVITTAAEMTASVEETASTEEVEEKSEAESSEAEKQQKQ